jgi:hypothetical protein
VLHGRAHCAPGDAHRSNWVCVCYKRSNNMLSLTHLTMQMLPHLYALPTYVLWHGLEQFKGRPIAFLNMFHEP